LSYRGDLLIAVLNNPLDLAIAREKGWYRIPVSSQEKWLKDFWPPRFLAFYPTNAFGDEAHMVRYVAEISGIIQAPRFQLFPDEPHNSKSYQRYFQVFINELQALPQPIPSRRARRITFIISSWEKLMQAQEINDLYYGSRLEELLWQELKRRGIWAEREEFITAKHQNFALDFAIYCVERKIDVETDGDQYHTNPEKANADNERDNLLKRAGWETVHFTTYQIQERLEEYCLPTLLDLIDLYGGLDDGGKRLRKINPKSPPGTYQPSLF
jgi:very-short-patch-repair endonuclease